MSDPTQKMPAAGGSPTIANPADLLGPLASLLGGAAPQVQLHKQIQPHSVELSLTAAGKVSASVKVYDDDPHSAFTRAAAVFDEVRKRYPEGKP